MPTSTVEDYVKQIYLEQQHVADALVPLGRLAAAMGVVPSTVTTMVKALDESELVLYEPRQGVRLTTAGEKLALHVLRRHRLVELFLVKVLNFDWSDVHEEAEELEHAISDRLLERIDEYLGRPGFDPHGDPIPTAAGKMSKRELRSLRQCPPPERVQIARITDQNPEFLKYVTARGLIPGSGLQVLEHDTIGDSVTILVKGQERLTLGGLAAGKILITAAEE